MNSRIVADEYEERIQTLENALDSAHEQIGGLKVENRDLTRALGLLNKENSELHTALTNLMPFVLEDYLPDYAGPNYKAAVENAKRLIE